MGLLWAGVDEASFESVRSAIRKRHTVTLLDGDQHTVQKVLLERLATEALGDLGPAASASNDWGITLFTSGSTGLPKCVIYGWDLIDWLIDDSLVQLAGGDEAARTVAFTSPAFSAGFLRALVSMAGPSVEVINPKKSSASAILQQVRQKNIDQISLVPALIDHLFDECVKSGFRLERVHTAYVFGEKLTWERVAKARRIISKTGVVVARYATTEAPGGVLNYKINHDHPLGQGLVPLGTPVYASRVKLVPHGSEGGAQQIAIGEPLATGYTDQQLTEERFVYDEDGSRWWLSGDLAEVDDEGVYHFRGRADDVIKRRGELVGPVEAEMAIRGIPGVADVAVVPTPFSEMDQHMVAHVVVESDHSLTPEQIMRKVFDDVGRSKAPDWLVRHEQLPRTSRGKIDRRVVQAKAYEKWLSAPTTPDSRLARGVIRIVHAVLVDAEIGYDTDLWSVGMDSLSALEIVVALEQMGFSGLEPSVLVEHQTPRALTGLLSSENSRRSSPMTTFNKQGKEKPVFVFPGAGTTAATFYPLAKLFGDEHPLNVFEPRQLPQSSPQRNPHQTQAVTAARVIERTRPSGPVLLIGHCAGGALAYETGRLLHERGFAVKLVMLNSLSTPPLAWNPFRKRLSLRAKKLLGRFASAARVYRRALDERETTAEEPAIGESSIDKRKRAYAEMGNSLISRSNRYSYRVPRFPVLVLTNSTRSTSFSLRPAIPVRFVLISGGKQDQLQLGMVEEVAEKSIRFFFGDKDSMGSP